MPESAAAAPADAGTPPSPETVREWPVLAHLPAPVPAGAPGPAAASPPIVRRLAALRPEQRAALSRLPALGAGEPLPAPLRKPMETLLGRELSDIRIHTSPLASTLGAEALATGRQMVFAPGRFAPHSRPGLALIAHELSHAGQALGFQTAGGAGPAPDDTEEATARQQEERIERLLKEGWPQAPARELRHAARALSPLAEAGGAAAPGAGGAAPPGAGEAPAAVAAGPPGAAPAGEQAALPVARVSEAAAPAAGAGAEAAKPDLDKLAGQVYAILKARLRAERDRHQVYGRP